MLIILTFNWIGCFCAVCVCVQPTLSLGFWRNFLPDFRNFLSTFGMTPWKEGGGGVARRVSSLMHSPETLFTSEDRWNSDLYSSTFVLNSFFSTQKRIDQPLSVMLQDVPHGTVIAVVLLCNAKWQGPNRTTARSHTDLRPLNEFAGADTIRIPEHEHLNRYIVILSL
jgi:hypothetical protein